jgi:hypothetical protein
MSINLCRKKSGQDMVKIKTYDIHSRSLILSFALPYMLSHSLTFPHILPLILSSFVSLCTLFRFFSLYSPFLSLSSHFPLTSLSLPSLSLSSPFLSFLSSPSLFLSRFTFLSLPSLIFPDTCGNFASLFPFSKANLLN